MAGFSKEFPNGKMTEIFRYPIAAITLMGYEKKEEDESPTMKLLGLGEFFINVFVQMLNPLLKMTICTVNEFQCPLTKDTPIIRMGQRTFILAFPGLLYALQFPTICGPTMISYLVRIFNRFCYYQDFADFSTIDSRYPCDDNEPYLWSIVRPIAEPMAHRNLTLFAHHPGLSRFCVSDYNSCFTRAIRLSATTKTITEAFISGALTVSRITIQDSHEPPFIPATPSITVFTCLVDAIEASTLISHGLAHHLFNSPPLLQSYPFLGFRVWRLNEVGVTTFVRASHVVAQHEEEKALAKIAEENSGGGNEKEGDHQHVTAHVDDKGKGKQVAP